MGIAKGIIKRAAEGGTLKDLNHHVLEYNGSVVASLGVAPGVFGRMLKTGIPVAKSVLKRKWISEEEI